MKKEKGPKAKSGRPPVESKKKPYQVMLDPRYVKHSEAFAKTQGMTIQELFRLALAVVVPNPFNAALVGFDQVVLLRDKAIAYAQSKSRKKSPLPRSEGGAEDRRP